MSRSLCSRIITAYLVIPAVGAAALTWGIVIELFSDEHAVYAQLTATVVAIVVVATLYGVWFWFKRWMIVWVCDCPQCESWRRQRYANS
jgi:hypothetical protein